MYRVVRKKIEVGTPAAATWPCSLSTSEQRKLRETERCHNASLRPRGVWASRPRRPATANVLRCFSRYRQRGRQSTRVWQVKVCGIYRERDCLELVRSVFYTFFFQTREFQRDFPRIFAVSCRAFTRTKVDQKFGGPSTLVFGNFGSNVLYVARLTLPGPPECPV